MAVQFVTKNTDSPSKPIEMARRNDGNINECFNSFYKAVADIEREQMAVIAGLIQHAFD